MSVKLTAPDPAELGKVFTQYSDFQFVKSGGYKHVFKVTTQDGSFEALKIIQIPSTNGNDSDAAACREEDIARALREISVLSKCNSPFVVKLATLPGSVLNIGGVECIAYSEEFLLGNSLLEVINSRVPISEAQAKSALRCLLLAIKDLWDEQKIVHRDIKPGNVMSTNLPDRPYVLLDLGIAYDVTEPGLTVRKDCPPMTFRYMAPEMADPNFRERIDFRTDIYTSALTVFEFAAGQHPLTELGDDRIKTISRALNQEPKKLQGLRPDISGNFSKILDQMLKKKPMLRYGNISQLLTILGV